MLNPPQIRVGQGANTTKRFSSCPGRTEEVPPVNQTSLEAAKIRKSEATKRTLVTVPKPAMADMARPAGIRPLGVKLVMTDNPTLVMVRNPAEAVRQMEIRLVADNLVKAARRVVPEVIRRVKTRKVATVAVNRPAIWDCPVEIRRWFRTPQRLQMMVRLSPTKTHRYRSWRLFYSTMTPIWTGTRSR